MLACMKGDTHELHWESFIRPLVSELFNKDVFGVQSKNGGSDISVPVPALCTFISPIGDVINQPIHSKRDVEISSSL